MLASIMHILTILLDSLNLFIFLHNQSISVKIRFVINDNSKVRLSIVIPAYMEEKNISSTLNSIKNYFENQPYSVEYIVVDDGSTDNTSQAARDIGANVIRLETNKGKGAAVRAGILAAKGEFILFTDADYPYDISSIELCFQQIERGADVVIGSRNLPGSDRGRERLKRKFISKIGNLVAQILILPGISDTQAGFKFFSSECGKDIFSRTVINSWGFDIEVLYLARILGYKIAQIPIKLIPRALKPSRVNSPIRTAFNVLWSIFVVYRNHLTGVYKAASQK